MSELKQTINSISLVIGSIISLVIVILMECHVDPILIEQRGGRYFGGEVFLYAGSFLIGALIFYTLAKIAICAIYCKTHR